MKRYFSLHGHIRALMPTIVASCLCCTAALAETKFEPWGNGGTKSTTVTKDKGTTKTHDVMKDKNGVKKEETLTVKDKASGDTTTTTTTYTADKQGQLHPDITTIVIKDLAGNTISKEKQVWGDNGRQKDGYYQPGGKGQEYKYDPNNLYYTDPDKTPPSNLAKPPKYPEAEEGGKKLEKPPKPKKSKGASKGESKSKGHAPGADRDYFFNTGESSHELKFGAGYRNAEVNDSDGNYHRGWFLAPPPAGTHGLGLGYGTFDELRTPPQEALVPPPDRMPQIFNHFDISISGVGFFGDGDRTVTTFENRQVERTFFTTERRTVTHDVIVDNGFTKVLTPVTVTKDVKVRHTVRETVRVKKEHEEGNFDESAGGINVELGYTRENFRVGVAALLMDGNDIFGGVTGNFYLSLPSLACYHECCGRDIRIVPYLVGGPGFFFGEQTVATGHAGLGLNIDLSSNLQGYAEYQHHWGSYSEHWSAVQLGLRIPLRERSRLGNRLPFGVPPPPPLPPPPP